MSSRARIFATVTLLISCLAGSAAMLLLCWAITYALPLTSGSIAPIENEPVADASRSHA